MKTDIDRLHKVVQGIRGRGVGKTFAACHHLAGTLELAEEHSTILWPLPQMNYIVHIKPMVEQVLTEHEIEYKWIRKYTLQCGTKIVDFRSEQHMVPGKIRQYDYEVQTYEQEAKH